MPFATSADIDGNKVACRRGDLTLRTNCPFEATMRRPLSFAVVSTDEDQAPRALIGLSFFSYPEARQMTRDSLIGILYI